MGLYKYFANAYKESNLNDKNIINRSSIAKRSIIVSNTNHK